MISGRLRTIRLRLTALFGVLFTLTSAVLIATAYLFVRNRPTRGDSAERNNGLLREALDEAGFALPAAPERRLQDRPDLPDEVATTLERLADDARNDVLNDLLSRSFMAFALTAAICLVLAWWIAGRALAPVDAITEAANRLSEDNLHERLPNDGPDDELNRLRTSFNSMLDRLERGFEARRRFAADASHELRTPLAVLGARADNILSGADNSNAATFAADVRTEVDRAERLVGALLAMAQSEQSTASHRPIDLAELVGDIAGALAPEADAASLTFDLELGEATIVGDESLVALLASNLVRNAIVHNEPGGWLSVKVEQQDAAAVLTVENTGAAVDVDELGDIFHRFNRGRDATDRHGHGLGLAITDAVATAHDAELVATARPGGGLLVEVSFDPVAQR